MSRIEKIKNILNQKFVPNELVVEDFTMDHMGHAGQGGGSETHFRVSIRSEELEDLSLLTAHRKIQDALKDEFQEGLHALEIKILK
ncbi:MAG: BolA family transcriptional regulator [Leptospira sp.]|nr:BolA family transcriptional regulator [Leptospira sp.]